MAYSVDTHSGGRTFIVEDGTVNNELDVRLVGKNFSGYGEIQNENVLHLLENFAGLKPPAKPINGQIWFDSSVKKLRFWDSSTSKWKTTGGIESASVAPSGLAIGDLWWDEKNKQLYAYDGNTYTLIGPQSVPGIGTSEMKVQSVTDTDSNTHVIIAAYVNGKVMYVISNSLAFTLDGPSKVLLGSPSEASTNEFNTVYPGITMIGTSVGGISLPENQDANSTSNGIIWGTASSAVGLVGPDNSVLDYNNFLSADTELGNFASQVNFSDEGYLLGNNNQLLVRISENPLEANTPIFKNQVGNTLKFQTTVSGVGTKTPLTLVANDILPSENNETDLGSTALKFKNVYANKFYGDGSEITNLSSDSFSGIITADKLTGSYDIDITGSSASSTNADKLKLGSLYVSSAIGSPDQGPSYGNTIVARDVDGNINASFFQGTATSALFADLAEKYLADAEYEVGTVVSVGGDAEVTACTLGDRAFGAVSANPAFKMNDGLVGGTYIALKGRVPVKVIGPVKKGDALIANNNGCVSAVSNLLKDKLTSYDTFAIALDSNSNNDIKLVEAIIL
jgi:hypothetical protein